MVHFGHIESNSFYIKQLCKAVGAVWYILPSGMVYFTSLRLYYYDLYNVYNVYCLEVTYVYVHIQYWHCFTQCSSSGSITSY